MLIFGQQLPLLFAFGMLLLGGYLSSRVFQTLGIPQVVGYVVLGLFLGESFFNILSSSTLDQFIPFTQLALALIGFLVGGELKKSIFLKYGKSYLTILLFEGILSMLFVSGIVWYLSRSFALAILLGALASATAPAATVDVIWEYKSRGPLSSTILAIVALDDGLALLLYGFAVSVATIIVAGGEFSIFKIAITPVMEIGGAAAFGLAGGVLADALLKFVRLNEQKIVIILGILLAACGAASALHLSLILTAMVMGTMLTNWHSDRHKELFTVLQRIAPPVYLFFFIFAGARLKIAVLPSIGVVGIAYTLFRFLGKYCGSWFGGWLSHSPIKVQRYLGLALFSQAGVAIGLSIDIYEKFQSYGPEGSKLGHQVMNIIAATTLVVQLIGPPLVKLALQKAGEIHGEV